MACEGQRTPYFVGGVKFFTMDGVRHEIDGVWDLVIAHPPCTYLTVSGNRWFDENKYLNNAAARYQDRVDGIKFFMQMVSCNAKRLAIENPIGIMSSVYRKPDQIIQPYEYGHNARKATCLWLRNLPPLKPTNIVDMGEINEYGMSHGMGADYCVDENGKIIPWNDPRTAIIRSRTFKGIAEAMADQWTV